MSEYGHTAFLEIGGVDKKTEVYSIYTPSLLELDSWNYTLLRGIDYRGKIETHLKGGNIMFFMSGIPRMLFWEWATDTSKYLSGNIYIRDTEHNTMHTVYFQDAALVSLKMKYINEGKAYMSIEGVLQAEQLRLEGASKPIDNRWSDDLYRSTSLSASSMEELEELAKLFLKNKITNGRVVPLEAMLELETQTYEMKSFEIEFSQVVNHNGQPDAEVRGGIATAGLYQMPDKYLNNWIRNVEKKSGFFRFGSELMGFPLKIEYEEALCIGCHAGTNNFSDEGCVCRMNILPQRLTFNSGIRFDVPYSI